MARVIDGFEIVRELGRGGMGAVYEARHPSMPRSVALKLILESATTPEALARFGREAELLARVKHPNVLRIHQLGRAPEGPYLVTELLEGEDLKALTRQGPLAPARAATIMSAVAQALAAVHAQGILHRDLKPQNVFVRSDGTPVLLDFGLARDVGAEKLTQTGAIVGTPAYMAPEQAGEGSTDALDVRSDVYGLGAILFRLLSGRAPYQGSAVSIIKQLLLNEPRWPSEDHLQTPPDLEAICRLAMAREPSDRYASAQDMADDLERFLSGARVRATPRGKRGRSQTLGTLVGGALVLAVVAGTVATQRDSQQAVEPPAPVTTERVAPVERPRLRDRWELAATLPVVRASRRRVCFVPATGREPTLRVITTAVGDSTGLRCFSVHVEESGVRVEPRWAQPLVWTGPEGERVIRGALFLAVDVGGRFAVLSRGGQQVMRVALEGELGVATLVTIESAQSVRALAISSEDGTVFAGYETAAQSRVVAIDAETGAIKADDYLGPARVESLGVIDGGNTVVGAEVDTDNKKTLLTFGAAFWSARGLRLRGERRTLNEGATAFASAPDGQAFALGMRGHGIRIFEPKDMSLGFPAWQARDCVGVDAVRHQAATRDERDLLSPTLSRAAHSAPPRALVFSPDGARLVSVAGGRQTRGGESTGGGDLRVFDVSSGAEVSTYRPEGGDMWSVDLVRDPAGEPIVAVGQLDGKASLLRAPSGTLLAPNEVTEGWDDLGFFAEKAPRTRFLRFVPGAHEDGPFLVSVGSEGERLALELWSLATPKAPRLVDEWPLDRMAFGAFDKDPIWVRHLAVDPRGEFALVGGSGSTLLRAWLFRPERDLEAIDLSTPRGGQVLLRTAKVAVAPDSSAAYVAGVYDHDAKDQILWRPCLLRVALDVSPPDVRSVAVGEKTFNPLRGLVATETGNVITGDNDNEGITPAGFRIFKTTTLRQLAMHPFARSTDGVTAMALGPGGRLAIGVRQHGLRLYRVVDGQVAPSLRWEASVAGARAHKAIRNAGKSFGMQGKHSPAASDGPIREICFIRAGAFVVTTSGDQGEDQDKHGDVRIFDAKTGQLRTRFPPQQPTGCDFFSLDATPDGRLIAVGQSSGQIRLLRPPPEFRR